MFIIHFNEFIGYGLPPGKMFTSSIDELEAAFDEFTEPRLIE
jgi:hypothetical protein